MEEIFTSNTSAKEIVMIDDVVDLSPKTSNQDFTSIVNEQNKQLQADKIASKTDARLSLKSSNFAVAKKLQDAINARFDNSAIAQRTAADYILLYHAESFRAT